MVSRGLLVTLAVCALAGFGCGLQPKDVDPYVKILARTKYTFGLTFDLGGKMCDIFGLVGSVRKAITAKINGYYDDEGISVKLSIGSSPSEQYIPLPKKLGSALETLYTGTKLIDLACQKRFSDVFTEKHFPFSYIFTYMWRRVLDFDGVEYGDEYTWLEEVPVNYLEIDAEFEFIESLDADKLSQYDSDEVTEILRLADLLKKVIEIAKSQNRQNKYLGQSVTLAISSLAGFSRACGASDVDVKKAIKIYEVIFIRLMNKKYGFVNDKDVQKDYISFCKGCVKKTDDDDE